MSTRGNIEQVEDYLPGEWLGPMLDGTDVEGKFKTRKGLVAMKRANLQVHCFKI